MTDFDVIVLGGGLAGMSMAAILGHYGIKTACIDANNPKDIIKKSHDIRTTAISYGSRHVLDISGIWKHVKKDACPIDDIHIMDGKSPGLLAFLTQDVEGKSFGWIIDNALLRKAMINTLAENKNITHLAPEKAVGFETNESHASVTLESGATLSAKLLIGADGRNSPLRNYLGIETQEWQYKQQALVFIAHHENPHNNIAVEHFRKEGPFAVLPMIDDKDGSHRSSVVWTEHKTTKKDDKSYADFSTDAFQAAITQRFPDFYGDVKLAGNIATWPLGYMQAKSYIGQRAVLIAEAAHVIHPIAGQGLNMSIRDVAALAEVIYNQKDPGALDLLEKYQSWRKRDNLAMGFATDSLNRLFSNDLFSVRMARSIGLEFVKKTPPVKQFFMKQAMGHMGSLPKLVRGDSLKVE